MGKWDNFAIWTRPALATRSPRWKSANLCNTLHSHDDDVQLYEDFSALWKIADYNGESILQYIVTKVLPKRKTGVKYLMHKLYGNGR